MKSSLFEVWCTTNKQPRCIVASYGDKELAKAHAKRLRKKLTKGERWYYKLGYITKRRTSYGDN